MNLDLSNIDVRLQVLKDIKSPENVQRKKDSFIDYEIYNDRIYPYVYDEIQRQTSKKTADAMPIVSTINLAQRIVNNEATIYNNDPRRTYSDITESDKKVIESIYDINQYNSKLQKVNKYFKYRKQGFIQVLVKDQSVHLRPLMAHHIDVIPDFQDPERAYAYIISAYDKSYYTGSDGTNQSIGDKDDFKASLERYVVWTAENNFIMDGKGNIKSEVVENPVKELTFIDVSKEKDFEFYVRTGMSLSEFTVFYNTAWSDHFYIQRMQGFSLGVFTGNPELMPKEYFVGPNRGIILPSDPNNPNNKIDFKFVSPTPNLEGGLKGIANILANFLTSRGVSPKTISSELSSSDTYSSGVERLLSMIDKFEATKEDFDLFNMVEQKVFNLVKKMLVAYTNTPLLNPDFNVSAGLASAKLSVQFHRPEMIQTEKEKLENFKLKIDMGISDKVLALMEIEGLEKEAAEEKIDEILERKSEYAAAITLKTNTPPIDDEAPLNENQIN